jgi:hypothetical protein
MHLTSLPKLLCVCCATTIVLSSAAARATVVDLSTSDSGTVNGAVFSIDSTQPAGTGVFDPFITLQNNGTEQGYNSSFANFDTKREPQWNHELQLSELQTVTVNSTQYYQFVVDVNEPGNGNDAKSLISLDMLKVWTSPTQLSSANTSTDANGTFNGSLGTLRYDLGAGNSVKYDDAHNGSGQADIAILIPTSVFADSKPTDTLYMYQQWGNTSSTEGGFEETSALTGQTLTPIPEVSTFLPLGAVLLTAAGLQFARQRRVTGAA